MRGVFRNKGILIIVALVIAALVFVVGQRMLTGASAAAVVPTAAVQRGDIQSTVLSSGALQPAADVNLTFGTAGTVQSIPVHKGDHVTKGTALASLDTRTLNLAVEQAQAGLVSAQAKLDTTKAGATAKDLGDAQSQ